MSQVFIIPFHVKPAENSVMPLGAKGAYVSCYTAASSYEVAVEKCLSALRADGIRIEEIMTPINIMPISDWTIHVAEQWPGQADQMPNQKEFEINIEAGNVIYGPFGYY